MILLNNLDGVPQCQFFKIVKHRCAPYPSSPLRFNCAKHICGVCPHSGRVLPTAAIVSPINANDE